MIKQQVYIKNISIKEIAEFTDLKNLKITNAKYRKNKRRSKKIINRIS